MAFKGKLVKKDRNEINKTELNYLSFYKFQIKETRFPLFFGIMYTIGDPSLRSILKNTSICHSERNEVKRRTELCELAEGNLLLIS
jgi:hypothetical protein